MDASTSVNARRAAPYQRFSTQPGARRRERRHRVVGPAQLPQRSGANPDKPAETAKTPTEELNGDESGHPGAETANPS
jgi:hypothetical protein